MYLLLILTVIYRSCGKLLIWFTKGNFHAVKDNVFFFFLFVCRPAAARKFVEDGVASVEGSLSLQVKCQPTAAYSRLILCACFIKLMQ